MQGAEEEAEVPKLDAVADKLIADESSLASKRQRKAALPMKEDYFLPEDERGSDAADGASDGSPSDPDLVSEDESEGNDSDGSDLFEDGSDEDLSDTERGGGSGLDLLPIRAIADNQDVVEVEESPEEASRPYKKQKVTCVFVLWPSRLISLCDKSQLCTSPFARVSIPMKR